MEVSRSLLVLISRSTRLDMLQNNRLDFSCTAAYLDRGVCSAAVSSG